MNTEKNLLLMIEETSYGSGIDALRDFWYSKNLCIAKDGAWEFSDDNLFDIMPSDKYTILDAALLDFFTMESGFEVLYYDSSPYIFINDIMLEDFSKYYHESLFQGKYERKEIELDGETAYCYPLNMILELLRV